MINVGELMDDPDFARCFTVKRPTVSIDAHGTSSTTYTEFDVVGVVQPAQPTEIQSMPEGVRVEDLISVWSKTRIVGSDGKATESDTLLIDGHPWRVVKEEPRPANGYYRVFATGYIP